MASCSQRRRVSCAQVGRSTEGSAHQGSRWQQRNHGAAAHKHGELAERCRGLHSPARRGRARVLGVGPRDPARRARRQPDVDSRTAASHLSGDRPHQDVAAVHERGLRLRVRPLFAWPVEVQAVHRRHARVVGRASRRVEIWREGQPQSQGLLDQREHRGIRRRPVIAVAAFRAVRPVHRRQSSELRPAQVQLGRWVAVKAADLCSTDRPLLDAWPSKNKKGTPALTSCDQCAKATLAEFAVMATSACPCVPNTRS